MMYSIFFFIFVGAVFSQDDFDPRQPHIRKHPIHHNVSKDDTLKLSCWVYGDPRPVIRWIKNNKFLATNNRTLIMADGSLVIKNVRRSDEGIYKCRAENDYGAVESEAAKVRFYYISDTFFADPLDNNVTQFVDLTLKCIAPNGFPTPTVTWTLDKKPLGLGNWEVVNNRYVSLLKLKVVTWKNHGNYRCHATNFAGYVVSQPAVVKVKVPAPVIVNSKTFVEVYSGKTVKLTCNVQYYQLFPDRVWTKLNGAFPSSRMSEPKDEDGVLIIKDTQLSDSGKYKCNVSNDAGSDTSTSELVVYEPPTIEDPPSETSVAQGYTSKLTCKVRGGKDPVVTWNFLGNTYERERTTGFTLPRIYVDNQYQLVVREAKLSDKGEVYCMVEDMGESFKSNTVMLLVLDVNVPPPRVTVSPTNISNVREGGQFMITCSATGEGLLYAWHHLKRKVSHSPPKVVIERVDGGNRLTVNNARIVDSGVYRCVVEGTGGSSSEKSNVAVIQSDDKKPAQVPQLTVMEIQPTSVKLVWLTPPSYSLAPITSYIITITESSTNRTHKTTSLGGNTLYRVIKDLVPATVYEFAVSAKNKNGEGPVKSTVGRTLPASPTPAPNVHDKLLLVNLKLTVGTINANDVQLYWNYVDPSRITSFIIYYRNSQQFKFSPHIINANNITSYVLRNLNADTRYEIYIKAANFKYESRDSQVVSVHTLEEAAVVVPLLVTLQKTGADELVVRWTPPEGVTTTGYLVSCMQNNGATFNNASVNARARKFLLSGVDPSVPYVVVVIATTADGSLFTSEKQMVVLRSYALGEYINAIATPSAKPDDDDTGSAIMRIIQEPWFIAMAGVLVSMLFLVVIVMLLCRRKKKDKRCKNNRYESSRGLLNASGMTDYANASLSRGRGPLRDPNFSWSESRHSDQVFTSVKKKKKSLCCCCCSSSASSVGEDFPNRVFIKPPTLPRNRHESIELRGTKSSNLDVSIPKENNVGVAMRNGYMVDTPLNNERHLLRRAYNTSEDHGEDRRVEDAPGLTLPPINYPMSSSPRFKTDSVERRHAEIVRTASNKTDAQLANVMENHPQATWKREAPVAPNKPPGENTLRRMGKSSFKPLPKLEVINWADGLPDPAKSGGSQQSSPKLSSTASMFGDNTELRAESRASQGGSNGSINKYPFEKRRRRTSNASSMMSSELYQSEMDPSAYSDVASERKPKKKVAPPPIDLDGLTSDILLQWAESVTNSSPSNSGSSSPSRLSGISSEGSLYTDADFAHAVAAVAECNGFNMDYEYPLVPINPVPLSSARNSKMDKIDQVLAQRSKLRNNKRQQQEFIPQISMSNYLTGSSRGPNSVSSSNGIPPSRAPRNMYGAGREDVETASNSSTPLTISNLMHHDSSLERGKKPLTMSNLNAHETSLERANRRALLHLSSLERKTARNKLAPPEPPLSVTSALERHESVNSKESINSSSKQDSEVENKPGTAERVKGRPKKTITPERGIYSKC